ncbi:hypothetical protein BGZ49_000246 [Haplosporangium sp. Z 27]|nr:hypothetical protein BGZ49_000246 [Haplosporangium sp. Z 27]
MGPEYYVDDQMRQTKPITLQQDAISTQAPSRTYSPELNLGFLFLEEQAGYSACDLVTTGLKQTHHQDLSPDMRLDELFQETKMDNPMSTSRRKRPRSQSSPDGDGWMTQSPRRGSRYDSRYHGSAMRVVAPDSSTISLNPTTVDHEEQKPVEPKVNYDKIAVTSELAHKVNFTEQLPSPFYAWKSSSASSIKTPERAHFENKKPGHSHGRHAIAVPTHHYANTKGHLRQRSEPWDHHNYYLYQRHDEVTDDSTGFFTHSDKSRDTWNEKPQSHNHKRRSIGHRGYRPAPKIQPVMGPEYDIEGLEQSAQPQNHNHKRRSIGHRGHRPAPKIQPIMGPEYNIEGLEQSAQPQNHNHKRRSIGHRGHRPAPKIQPIMGPEYDIEGLEQSAQPPAGRQDTEFIPLSPELNNGDLFLENPHRDSGQDPVANRMNQVYPQDLSPDLNLKELFQEASPSSSSVSRGMRSHSNQVVDDQGWMTQSSKRNSHYGGSAMRVFAPATSTLIVNSTSNDHDEQEPKESIINNDDLMTHELDRRVRSNEQPPSTLYAWKDNIASLTKKPEKAHLENKRPRNSHGHHAFAVQENFHKDAESHWYQQFEPWEHYLQRKQDSDDSCNIIFNGEHVSYDTIPSTSLYVHDGLIESDLEWLYPTHKLQSDESQETNEDQERDGSGICKESYPREPINQHTTRSGRRFEDDIAFPELVLGSIFQVDQHTEPINSPKSHPLPLSNYEVLAEANLEWLFKDPKDVQRADLQKVFIPSASTEQHDFEEQPNETEWHIGASHKHKSNQALLSTDETQLAHDSRSCTPSPGFVPTLNDGSESLSVLIPGIPIERHSEGQQNGEEWLSTENQEHEPTHMFLSTENEVQLVHDSQKCTTSLDMDYNQSAILSKDSEIPSNLAQITSFEQHDFEIVESEQHTTNEHEHKLAYTLSSVESIHIIQPGHDAQERIASPDIDYAPSSIFCKDGETLNNLTSTTLFDQYDIEEQLVESEQHSAEYHDHEPTHTLSSTESLRDIQLDDNARKHATSSDMDIDLSRKILSSLAPTLSFEEHHSSEANLDDSPVHTLSLDGNLQGIQLDKDYDPGSIFSKDSKILGSPISTTPFEQHGIDDQLVDLEHPNTCHHYREPAHTLPSTESLLKVQPDHDAQKCATSPDMDHDPSSILSKDSEILSSLASTTPLEQHDIEDQFIERERHSSDFYYHEPVHTLPSIESLHESLHEIESDHDAQKCATSLDMSHDTSSILSKGSEIPSSLASTTPLEQYDIEDQLIEPEHHGSDFYYHEPVHTLPSTESLRETQPDHDAQKCATSPDTDSGSSSILSKARKMLSSLTSIIPFEQHDAGERIVEPEHHGSDFYQHEPAHTLPSTESPHEIQPDHDAQTRTTSPDLDYDLALTLTEYGEVVSTITPTTLLEEHLLVPEDHIIHGPLSTESVHESRPAKEESQYKTSSDMRIELGPKFSEELEKSYQAGQERFTKTTYTNDKTLERQNHHDTEIALSCIQSESSELNLGPLFHKEHSYTQSESPMLNLEPPFREEQGNESNTKVLSKDNRVVSGFIQLHAGSLIAQQLSKDVQQSPTGRNDHRHYHYPHYKTNEETPRPCSQTQIISSQHEVYDRHLPRREHREGSVQRQEVESVENATTVSHVDTEYEPKFIRSEISQSQSYQSQPKPNTQLANKKKTLFGIEFTTKPKSKKQNTFGLAFDYKEIKKSSLENLKNQRRAESSESSRSNSDAYYSALSSITTSARSTPRITQDEYFSPAFSNTSSARSTPRITPDAYFNSSFSGTTSAHSTPRFVHETYSRSSSYNSMAHSTPRMDPIRTVSVETTIVQTPAPRYLNQENTKEMHSTTQKRPETHKKPASVILEPSSAISVNAAGSLKASRPSHVHTSDSIYESTARIPPADKGAFKKPLQKKDSSAFATKSKDYPSTREIEFLKGNREYRATSAKEPPESVTRPIHGEQDRAEGNSRQVGEPFLLSSRLFKKPSAIERETHYSTGGTQTYLTGVKQPQVRTAQSASNDTKPQEYLSISGKFFRSKVEPDLQADSKVSNLAEISNTERRDRVSRPSVSGHAQKHSPNSMNCPSGSRTPQINAVENCKTGSIEIALSNKSITSSGTSLDFRHPRESTSFSGQGTQDLHDKGSVSEPRGNWDDEKHHHRPDSSRQQTGPTI